MDRPALLTVEVGDYPNDANITDFENVENRVVNSDEMDQLLGEYEGKLKKIQSEVGVGSGAGSGAGSGSDFSKNFLISETKGNNKHNNQNENYMDDVDNETTTTTTTTTANNNNANATTTPAAMALVGQPNTLLNMTPERADTERMALMDNLNHAFSTFLSSVQSTAKIKTCIFDQDINYYSHHSSTLPTNPHAPLIKDILNMEQIDIEEWSRKKSELIATMTVLDKRQKTYKDMVQRDLSLQPTSTVASHLACALNYTLDEHHKINEMDLDLISKVYSAQNNIMKKTASSYITFNSWLLDHWNRSMVSITNAYKSVQSNIDKMFQQNRMHQDIEQLLDRYEKFLQVHEHLLPMEFTLSTNPRKEWRDYLGKNQPEECLRLIKNELRSLEPITQLEKSISVWNKELEQYDISRLSQMNEKRARLKKRLEDAVETETKKVCEQKWNTFNQYIFKMGSGVQREASVKLAKINEFYNHRHKILASKNNSLLATIYGYESKLALMDYPWANWLEKRKMTQREWFKLAYWEKAVSALVDLYNIVKELNEELQKYDVV